MKALLVLVTSCVISLGLLSQTVSNFVASVQAAKSVQAISEGDGLKALRNIESAKKLSPRVSTYPKMKAQYLSLWIKANPETRPILEPVISLELERAIKLNPLYFRHYLKASVMLKDLGYIERAVTAYEQAVILVPNSVKLRNGLASMYIYESRYEEAENQLKLALKMLNGSPWSYETYYVAAFMYQTQGNKEAAVGALFTGLSIAPNSPLCYEIIKELRLVVRDFDSLYHKHNECGYLIEAELKGDS